MTEGAPDSHFYSATKRLIDLLFALGVIIFFWWMLLIIWAGVRAQSPGPGVFAQKRIGRNEQEFICYKFRTMKIGTDHLATHEVSIASVTTFGRFLRWSKLDELPQVWNIFRNEMALVGPRPCLPGQLQVIEARRALGVTRLKPGITGLAQINNIDMRDAETLARCDAQYAALRSIFFDGQILIATMSGRGLGDSIKGTKV